MSADALLSRLEGVRKTGADRWIARCPAHDDGNPSLAIRALPDGRVLAKCFALCDIEDVITAAGLDMTVLFPERPLSPNTTIERRPFNAHDVLRCVAFEVTIARLCSSAMRAGEALSDEDDARLALAFTRLMAADGMINVN